MHPRSTTRWILPDKISSANVVATVDSMVRRTFRLLRYFVLATGFGLVSAALVILLMLVGLACVFGFLDWLFQVTGLGFRIFPLDISAKHVNLVWCLFLVAWLAIGIGYAWHPRSRARFKSDTGT